MSVNAAISSQELLDDDERSNMESTNSNKDNMALSPKDRLETEPDDKTESKDLSCVVSSMVINDMHKAELANTGTDHQLQEKVSLVGGDNDSPAVIEKDSDLESQVSTCSIINHKPQKNQNDIHIIPESLHIQQHATSDTELSNPNEQSLECPKIDTEKVCEAVQMDYRGIDSNFAKSDTSSLSSVDESSSELSDSEGPTKGLPDDDVGIDDDEDEDGGKQNQNNGKTKVSWPQSLPRTKGELCLDDLPPIEELTITVGDDVKMVEVGKITSTVHTLVVVQAKADLPPLNEDTILFLEGKKVLGQVFETFGPVSAPLYSVRFNTPEQIQERELHPGLIVYYAADAPEYTHYVFMAHLQSIKASDASWEHNNEPPPQCLDYSDDEEERRAKGQLKQEKRNHMQHDDDDNGNIMKGKRPKSRKPKGGYGHQENIPTSKSSQRKPAGTDTWPPKDYQSWPPNDRMAKCSQNGRMSSTKSYNSSLGADNSQPQNYRFMGFKPAANRFKQSQQQETFSRGQPRNQGYSASSASLLGAPPGGVPASRLSVGVMQPGPPGVGPSVPQPSAIPRHPSPRMLSRGSSHPRNQSLDPSQSMRPRHMMNMQCPNSGQQSWQPSHSRRFNLPLQSVLPPYEHHMRHPPPMPHIGGERGDPGSMGFSYDGNYSATLNFNDAPPYNRPEQQFGGEPHFSCGPVGSFSTNWGVNHSYQQ